MNYITAPGYKAMDSGKYVFVPVVKDDIVKEEVLKYFELTFNQINVKSRKREVVYARQVMMYFLKKFSLPTLVSVAEVFGKDDHSFAHYAIETIKNLIFSDPLVRGEVEWIQNRILAR